MIPLPSKRKLQRRVDAEYEYLHSIIHCCSVHQVEDCMRRIHILIAKIKSYGKSPQKEINEIFDND